MEPDSALERFWSKVRVANGHWLWVGAKNSDGYGVFWFEGKNVLAHRWLFGEVEEGKQLDHLCRIRNCVWPEHLEVVTNQENAQRGDTGKWQTAKKQCPRGHPYSGINTYYYAARNERQCKTCRGLARRKWRTSGQSIPA